MTADLLETPSPPAGPADNSLLTRIAEYPHLPTLPDVALEVIQKASLPDCELEEIHQIILRDPLLCSQVLRAVNSAMYGLQQPIVSMDRAVGYLGLKSVRSLVLSLSLPTLRLPTQSHPRLREFWRTSVTSAILARELAVKLGRRDAEDDMVAALLADLGVFVLQLIFPTEYSPVVNQSAERLANHQCALEMETLGVHHADVSALILRRWRLPDDITEAIRHHHAPDQVPARDRVVFERSRLVYLAIQTAHLQEKTHSHPALLRRILGQVCDQLALTEAQFLDVLDPLNRKIDEFVSILQLEVGVLASFPMLVANATVELIQRAQEGQLGDEEPPPGESELKLWKRIAHRLRKDATRDRLTGAYNRSYFGEILPHEYRRARRRCTVLGLIVVDMDDFKALNDTYSLPFGDEVLKEIASALKREVRPADIVARLAGDRFAVLVPDTNAEAFATLAQRLWHAVSNLCMTQDDAVIRGRASFGAVVCVPARLSTNAGDLLTRALQARDIAKREGKNRIHLETLVSEEDLAFLGEIQRRLFSTFLLERDIVTREQVHAAEHAAPATAVMLGRLARQLNWLTPKQLHRVLRDRRARRRSFVESALALRVLTAEQGNALLAIRREPPGDLGEGLVDVQALSGERAVEEVEDYFARVEMEKPPPARKWWRWW